MTRQIFIDAKYLGEIKFTDEVLNYLKKNKIKSIAIFAATQFTEIKEIKKQLEELKIELKTTKAKRTSNEMQILGCDAYHDSFEDDIITASDLTIYIGDGLFHPKALLLAQSKNRTVKPILIYDPISKQMSIIDKSTIQAQIQKMKRNLKMFINADTIGILVTTKPGQQYLNTAKNLKKHLQKQNKKAYIFIDDTLDLSLLENYPFIKAWVNTSCPRIGTDDITSINQPLINIKEASNPTKALEELESN